MITKDEEMTIGPCIESVRDIVDEIVVVDTGSTDKTVEILMTFGAKVIEHELADDFSRARNLSLRAASGDWILVLDADERIEQKDLPTLGNLAGTGECAGYFLPLHIYLAKRMQLMDYKRFLPTHTQPSEKKTIVDYKLSFFRNISDIYYENLVHENVTNSIRVLNRPCEVTEVIIHNFPRPPGDRSHAQENKYEELLEKQISINPNDSRAHWFLGCNYYGRGMRTLAAKEFEKASRSLSRPVEALQACLSLAQIYIEDNKFVQALDVCRKSQEICLRHKDDVELKINARLLAAIHETCSFCSDMT